jgi:membrane protein DedA with SNARE-associated domain
MPFPFKHKRIQIKPALISSVGLFLYFSVEALASILPGIPAAPIKFVGSLLVAAGTLIYVFDGTKSKEKPDFTKEVNPSG